MSKAILVIDMPECCDLCPLQIGTEWEDRCAVTKDRVSAIRPDWCPLKPIPEKRLHFTSSDYWGGFVDGHNSCVIKIIGE